jgi:hypothetical protein
MANKFDKRINRPNQEGTMNRKSLIGSAVASTFVMFGCLSGEELADDQYDVNSMSRATVMDNAGLVQPSPMSEGAASSNGFSTVVAEFDGEIADGAVLSCGNVDGWGVGCYGIDDSNRATSVPVPAHYCDGNGPAAMDRACPSGTVEDYVVNYGYEVNAARYLTQMQACPVGCSLTIEGYDVLASFGTEVAGDSFKCVAVHTTGNCIAD